MELSLAGHLKRILGVDLTTIPGLNVLMILTLLSEIGSNMAKWRNEKAFVSWLGLSPNNKISGQRVLSSRTRKVINRAATTSTSSCDDTWAKPILPWARSIAENALNSALQRPVSSYRKEARLSDLPPHQKRPRLTNESDVRIYELKYKDQILNSLRKRANSFGFELVEASKGSLKATSNVQVSEKPPSWPKRHL